MSAAAAMRTVAKIVAIVTTGIVLTGAAALALTAWLAPAHFLRG